MIGIDVGQRDIRLVALARRFGRWRLQACASEPIDPEVHANTAMMADTVQRLITRVPPSLWRRPRSVAMALPIGEVSLHWCEIPAGTSQTEAGFVAAMEAERHAVPGESLYLDYRQGAARSTAGGSELMVLLCAQSRAEQCRSLLASAGSRLTALGVDELVISDTYACHMLHPQSGVADVLTIDVGASALRLTVFCGAAPVYWRSHGMAAESGSAVSVLTRALQHYRMSDLPARPGRVLLHGSGAGAAHVVQTVALFFGVVPEIIDPFAYFGVSVPADICAPAFALAAALAAQELP